MNHELQNIISGTSQVRHGDTIQTIARYLRKSKSLSGTLKESKSIKREETTLKNLSLFDKAFCD